MRGHMLELKIRKFGRHNWVVRTIMLRTNFRDKNCITRTNKSWVVYYGGKMNIVIINVVCRWVSENLIIQVVLLPRIWW